MPDWSKSMRQTFECYRVDSGTWRDAELIANVKPSTTLTRDSDTETLGSATIDIDAELDECYVRIYIVTIQNGIREKTPLGTYLVISPSTGYDGKTKTNSMDGYTPLIELKEKQPPIGYSIFKDSNVMENAYLIVRDNVRAPVVRNDKTDKLYGDFVANTDDTWMSYVSDLISNAKCELGLDELGRILFPPVQKIAALQPVWTYSDDDDSVIYSDITIDHDLYDIPNVVEVIYSYGSEMFYSRVVNDDPNSPVSTVSRGREITHRVTDLNMSAMPSQEQIDDYAKDLLESLSTVSYTISYTHGYCPVRLGDCVRIDYKEAGLNGVKAKVISQSIKCETGCPVSEKAVATVKMWGDS